MAKGKCILPIFFTLHLNLFIYTSFIFLDRVIASHITKLNIYCLLSKYHTHAKHALYSYNSDTTFQLAYNNLLLVTIVCLLGVKG